MQSELKRASQAPEAEAPGPAPAAGQKALVRTSTFQCLAVYHADGKWRSAFTHEELQPVKIIRLF